MLHLPILRKGAPYKSIDLQRVPHFKTREPFVALSQANPGLIRRDLLDPEPLPEVLGPSLVVTALTHDQQLINKLIASPHVDRLNIGAIPTMVIAWDQPHEGNWFEHLCARRAFQRAAAA